MENRRNDEEADRFLKEGRREFLPAIRALNSFVHEIESRIRAVLKPHDQKLNQFGIASSVSKLFFVPSLGEEQQENSIEIGVRNPDRSAFFILIDPTESPSRSFYVGFWVWTPALEDRQELHRMLRPIWDLEPYETEQSNHQILYVGRYLNEEEYFPAFEEALDKLALHVIAGLGSVNFIERFGPKFHKVKSSAV